MFSENKIFKDSYTRIALEDGIPGHPQTNTVIYVVNAFYDRRVLWDNAENITIRVFLLSSSVNVMNMTSLHRMACVSGDKVSNAWLKNLGKMSEFVYRKRNYDQYALSCSIKDTQNPFFQVSGFLSFQFLGCFDKNSSGHFGGRWNERECYFIELRKHILQVSFTLQRSFHA